MKDPKQFFSFFTIYIISLLIISSYTRRTKKMHVTNTKTNECVDKVPSQKGTTWLNNKWCQFQTGDNPWM